MREKLLPAARRLHDTVRPPGEPSSDLDVDASGQAASDAIKGRLLDGRPCMVARPGAVELGSLVQYLAIHSETSTARKSLDYVTGRSPRFWWQEGDLEAGHNAGFFPRDLAELERFCRLMLDVLGELDVVGVTPMTAALLSAHGRMAPPDAAVKVQLRDLEPYYHRDPWTEALEGRTVLVVHPYAESIERQYGQRSDLFADPRVLPEFQLRTLTAVQSLDGSNGGFGSWFDAYQHMCDEIARSEFDVAIIGCGAYGFPLAAHVKRLGRQAVHLGGAVQILFGIKGRRWDQHEVISRLYNEHWVRPLPSERPANYRQVEDGAYW